MTAGHVFRLVLAGAPLLGGGCSPRPAEDLVPLALYTDCSAIFGSSPSLADDQCAQVSVVAGGRTLGAGSTVCGDLLCKSGLGYGLGQIGNDGLRVQPIFFKCLPPDAGTVEVSVCVPGFKPLTTSRTSAPVPGPACAEPSTARFTHRTVAVSYPLLPADAGEVCPTLDVDAGSFEWRDCPCF